MGLNVNPQLIKPLNPSFNIRIPIIAPVKGRGFINQGSTLVFRAANFHRRGAAFVC